MKETALRIRVFGDPVLRKKAKLVSRVTGAHRDILSQMSRLMYDASGIGLAASQVGISECLIVVDIGSGLYKLINPRVVKKKGRQKIEEGCLSVPGVCIKVSRAKEVVVEALDEEGKPVVIEAKDLLACALQHEIDHLKGKLIVDYAGFLDKLKIKRRLRQLKKGLKDEKQAPLLV
ncbi:MAG: peptide deformylase [Candidatus Omnitrophota bacterium]|nr:peptide deformylase [Candidatus Omnitrophota bacterium]